MQTFFASPVLAPGTHTFILELGFGSGFKFGWGGVPLDEARIIDGQDVVRIWLGTGLHMVQMRVKGAAMYR